MLNTNIKISIIVATYNWPKALNLCLQSLVKQTDSNYEIIVADDGSGLSTQKIIDEIRTNYLFPIKHVWQEDDGCRKTRIANKAIEVSEGSYLVFIDGDCIAQPDFIHQHRKLAQENCMTTGSRVLLSEKLTRELLSKEQWDFIKFKNNLFKFWLTRDINKILQLLFKRGDGNWRNFDRFFWKRIKGCNMACWKSDAIAINGFDESLVGWAHEDADFVFRLEHSGIQRKSGAWATEVIHLYHHVRDQSLNSASVLRLQEKIEQMKASTPKKSY